MSDTRLFLRRGELLIETASGVIIDLSEFQYQFQTNAAVVQTLKNINIRIYNLHPQTAREIKDEGLQLVLKAGYQSDDSYGIIFSGQIIQVSIGKNNGTDTFIDIQATDGERLFNEGFVSVTLDRGTTQNGRLAQIIDSSSVTAEGWKDYSNTDTPNKLPRGRVYHGQLKKYLRSAAAQVGADVNIENNTINIIPVNTYKNNEPHIINSDTGMVGLPTQMVEGIQVMCLLNPNIAPGDCIQLDNDKIQLQRQGLSTDEQGRYYMNTAPLSTDGKYKALTVTHQGDNRGNDWYTTIICWIPEEAIKSQIPYTVSQIPQ